MSYLISILIDSNIHLKYLSAHYTKVITLQGMLNRKKTKNILTT